MKKCDYIKDLILTDYIDGELDKDSIGRLEGHLLDCSDCRAFLKEVKEYSLFLARRTSHQPVPEELWEAVRQNIEQEKINRDAYQLFLWIPACPSGLLASLEGAGMTVTYLKKLVPVTTFRMVPVFASLILMFLAGSVALNNLQVQRAKDKAQGEYLVSLLGPASNLTPMDSNDFGTPIEHYFL